MYNDSETEPDVQVLTETIRLSDDSSGEYQNSRSSDQTESDTKLDTEDNDIPDVTAAGLRHRSRTVTILYIGSYKGYTTAHVAYLEVA